MSVVVQFVRISARDLYSIAFTEALPGEANGKAMKSGKKSASRNEIERGMELEKQELTCLEGT